VRQLAARIPMKAARRRRFAKMLFHRIADHAAELKAVFDIDVFDGVTTADVAFVTLMFHRRHVYEHNGGEADEKYIRDSGESSVRPKQALRETPQSLGRLIDLVTVMARNLHRGFHDIFPPEDEPIRRHREQMGRRMS